MQKFRLFYLVNLEIYLLVDLRSPILYGGLRSFHEYVCIHYFREFEFKYDRRELIAGFYLLYLNKTNLLVIMNDGTTKFPIKCMPRMFSSDFGVHVYLTYGEVKVTKWGYLLHQRG